MSKSKGNLVFVSQLRQQGEDPRALRLAILAHHYRENWTYSTEVLNTAYRRLRLWEQAAATTGSGTSQEDATDTPYSVVSAVENPHKVTEALELALCDDLNTPEAIAVIDAWAKATVENSSDNSADLRVLTAIDALLGISLV